MNEKLAIKDMSLNENPPIEILLFRTAFFIKKHSIEIGSLNGIIIAIVMIDFMKSKSVTITLIIALMLFLITLRFITYDSVKLRNVGR